MNFSVDKQRRKQLHRWENPFDIRFITFSTHCRLPLQRYPEIMDLFASELFWARRHLGLRVYAWVIMPEHVYVVVRPETIGWDYVSTSIKTAVARRVLSRWRDLDAPILSKLRVGTRYRFWLHGGGFDRNSRDLHEITGAIRYVHQNPVKRGLTQTPDEWRWSSVRWWRGTREGEYECDPLPGPGWEKWKGYV